MLATLIVALGLRNPRKRHQRARVAMSYEKIAQYCARDNINSFLQTSESNSYIIKNISIVSEVL